MACHQDLDAYRKRIYRMVSPISCSFCSISILPKHYEKHCSAHHSFNSKLGCVWCQKKFWKSGDKHKHGHHLYMCSETFIHVDHEQVSTPPPSPRSSTLHLFTLEHMFPQKKIFAFNSLPTPEYDAIWPLPVEPPPLTYQDDNLNLALSYLYAYLETKDSRDWLHVMVKAVAFDSFVRAMDLDEGYTRTLLFSCWCNGGPHEEVRHRQHRHMIVTSPNHHFEQHVWSKVQVPNGDRPGRNFLCKGMERIVSPLHLVHTLGYVSHRKSQCTFTTRPLKTTPYKLHHFYLYRTLPMDFRILLCLSYESGLSEYLYQEKFQNVSISRLVERPLIFSGGRWHQKIKHFYNNERGLVLPVSKCFEPTHYDHTLSYVHLLNGRKLHFLRRPENEALDAETWLGKQADGGNCFYEAVEQETWTPRPRDQTSLNTLMPYVERCRELEAALKKKDEEVEECKTKEAEWKRKCESHEEEAKQANSKIRELYDIILVAKNEEIVRLKEENDQLRKRNQYLESLLNNFARSVPTSHSS